MGIHSNGLHDFRRKCLTKGVIRVQEGWKEPKGDGLQAQTAQGPQGQKNRKMGLLSTLEFGLSPEVNRACGVCVGTDLHFCVQETGLKEQGWRQEDQQSGCLGNTGSQGPDFGL